MKELSELYTFHARKTKFIFTSLTYFNGTLVNRACPSFFYFFICGSLEISTTVPLIFFIKVNYLLILQLVTSIHP